MTNSLLLYKCDSAFIRQDIPIKGYETLGLYILKKNDSANELDCLCHYIELEGTFVY